MRTVALALCIWIHTASSLNLFEDDEFGSCDGCFCIVGTGEDDTCPVEVEPETNFDSLIPILRGMKLSRDTFLGCDPYQNNDCERIPEAVEGGACIVTFSKLGTCPENWEYSLSTYPGTVQEALDEGLYVTHSGPCGVCSSLQDLSVYMEVGPNLRRDSGFCGIIGVLGYWIGQPCFRNLGFTNACSDIWYYNTRHTSRNCLFIALFEIIFNVPPNGPGPECALSSSIECNEINSGPIFEEFAGRTRRTSGLLSNIVRPCSMFDMVQHLNPCLAS